MPPRPDFAEFRQLAAGHTVVPVFRDLLCDSLTPVAAYRRLGAGDWSFLFESVVGGERVGRYSFLGTDPFLRLEARDDQLTLTHADGRTETRTVDRPLAELGALVERYRAPALPDLPRFCGGAVGYVAYDAVRRYEPLPNPPADDRGLPDLAFGFHDQMVVFDHITKLAKVVVLAHVDPHDLEGCYRTAVGRLEKLVARLSTPGPEPKLADLDRGAPAEIPWTSNFTQETFEAAVRKGQEYIRAGDFFQFVPSQRLTAETTAAPFDAYRALRVVNPSPFMVYLPMPQATLVAGSPEIMVRVENGHATVRPLAGTRPRGATPAEDDALAAELLADPKERAEHVMLVDLGRNDLGRVAEFGTVKIDDLMVVERYSHVMHITSNVSGQLRPGVRPIDALAACLPAGTVSGAPKVRAMQVIDELEPCRRGPYGGAIGYLDFAGNMDTCIALRTLVMQNGKAYIQAGAGVVLDSDPASEYHETLNKAKAMLKALALAERLA